MEQHPGERELSAGELGWDDDDGERRRRQLRPCRAGELMARASLAARWGLLWSGLQAGLPRGCCAPTQPWQRLGQHPRAPVASSLKWGELKEKEGSDRGSCI